MRPIMPECKGEAPPASAISRPELVPAPIDRQLTELTETLLVWWRAVEREARRTGASYLPGAAQIRRVVELLRGDITRLQRGQGVDSRRWVRL